MRLIHFSSWMALPLLAGGLALFSTARAGVDAPDAKDMKMIAAIRPEETREPRVWVSPEYVHYWQNTTPRLPALLSHTQPGAAGDISPLGTFYGDQGIHWDNGNGGKLTVGGWFDPAETYGLELSGFFIPKQTQQRNIPIAPLGDVDAFFNDFSATPPVPTANAFPGPAFAGASASYSYSTIQYGGELNALYHAADFHPNRDLSVNINLLGGFRYLGEQDDYSDAYSEPAAMAGNNFFFYQDTFKTRNNFYGANLGAHIRIDYNHFFAELTPKIALGVTDEEVDVSGANNVVSAPGPGGFYASGNKLGTRTKAPFAYLPELTLKVGYEFNSMIEGWVGYDALYLSDIARVENQISTNLDFNTIAGFGAAPGNADGSPTMGVQSSSLFEQGVTAGLTFKL